MSIRTINTKATCGYCRQGQNYGVPAVALVRGKGGDGKRINAYLCSDHIDCIQQDGGTVSVKSLTGGR